MEKKIIEIFANQLEIKPETITADTLIAEELGAHSLDIVEILADIEDTLGVIIPDEVIPDFKTVGDVITCVESTQN